MKINLSEHDIVLLSALLEKIDDNMQDRLPDIMHRDYTVEYDSDAHVKLANKLYLICQNKLKVIKK